MSVALTFVLAIWSLKSCVADQATAELIRLLPAESNVLSIVRVARILGTERARAENWEHVADQNLLAGGSSIPPWIDTLVVGSLVRPATNEEVWSTAVLRLPESVTMERIAHREESRVEKIDSLRAVHGRRNAWMVELKPHILGVRSPAVRQEAVRWARSVATENGGQLSDYLRRASGNPAHIVFAIDLKDVAAPWRVREVLEQSNLLPEDPIARVDVPNLLSKLEGVSLQVTIDKVISAQVVIEFDTAPNDVSEIVASIFRQIVADHQMSLEEFDQAKVTAGSKSVTLTMSLSDGSLRQILSLITSPSPPHGANDETIPSPAPRPAPAPGIRTSRVAPELAASKRYYRAVSQAIDDLARVNQKAKEYGQTATWHDNFARKIEQLATVGVDPALVNFGKRISDRFHALSASLRGQGVQVSADQQTLVYDVDYRPGWVSANWWGGVGYGESSIKVSSNLQEVREKQVAAVVKGSQQRATIWQLITEDRKTIESSMRETYGAEFFQRR